MNNAHPEPMGLLEAARELSRWAGRAREMIPAEERKILTSPASILYRIARYALFHEGDGIPDDLSERDLASVELFVDLFRIIGRAYFRVQFVGTENVPKEGGALLVGNHNGGLLPADSFMTGVALFDSQPRDRAMFALAHDFLFDDPTFRKWARRLGILRAGHEGARKALSAGHMVLVYPGSDYDAFRPFTERNRVVLAGRKGFLKLALRAGVPIVPVVAKGSHAQFIVLTRGDRLGRALGVHRFGRTDVMPIALSIPWGLTSGFTPYIPYPTKVTIAFGEPVRFPHLGPEAAEDPVALESCYREVESRMQAMLDRLVARDR